MSKQQPLALNKELKHRRLQYIPIHLLVDPESKSITVNDKQLIENLAKHGLIQPLIVIPSADKYHVVSGQRQFACCAVLFSQRRLLEGDVLPCFVEAPEQIGELLLAENLQRRELDVIYEAELMDACCRHLQLNGPTTQKDLAGYLNLPEAYVRSTLKILALPEEIKSQWKQKRHFFKKTQLLEIARKKPEEQLSAWKSVLAKTMREKEQRNPASASKELQILQSMDNTKTKNAITLKPRQDNITFANSNMTPSPSPKAADKNESPQPVPPSELDQEQLTYEGSETALTIDDLQEVKSASNTRQKTKTPLVRMPTEEPSSTSAETPESRDEYLLQIDLEDQLPDFEFAVTAMLHDLSKFNPAKYQVRNKEALIEALDVFINELMETAKIARDIKSKLDVGPEAATKQLAELMTKAGIRNSVCTQKPIDLSRNSFNEVIEKIIKSLPGEELERLEKTFQHELKLNPTLKKRLPERYNQILHGLLIDYFMEQVEVRP